MVSGHTDSTAKPGWPEEATPLGPTNYHILVENYEISQQRQLVRPRQSIVNLMKDVTLKSRKVCQWVVFLCAVTFLTAKYCVMYSIHWPLLLSGTDAICFPTAAHSVLQPFAMQCVTGVLSTTEEEEEVEAGCSRMQRLMDKWEEKEG